MAAADEGPHTYENKFGKLHYNILYCISQQYLSADLITLMNVPNKAFEGQVSRFDGYILQHVSCD